VEMKAREGPSRKALVYSRFEPPSATIQPTHTQTNNHQKLALRVTILSLITIEMDNNFDQFTIIAKAITLIIH
jgi:hypothetical protein